MLGADVDADVGGVKRRSDPDDVAGGGKRPRLISETGDDVSDIEGLGEDKAPLVDDSLGGLPVIPELEAPDGGAGVGDLLP